MGVAVESYEEACAAHRWHVPERYNIAADVCDKHPRDKLAMVQEDSRRQRPRASAGASCRTSSNRFANVAARRTACSAATASRCCCRRRPETAAAFFGTWKAGAILLSMSVLYGDEGIRHRAAATRRRRCWSPTPPTRARIDADLVEQVSVLDDGAARRRARPTSRPSTPPPTTRPSSTTRRARPGSPRASCTPTATSSPTRSSSTATTSRTASCFHGMGEWAWAAGIAPLLGPWRLGAVQFVFQRAGRLRPAPAARRALAPRGRRTSSRRRRRCAR